MKHPEIKYYTLGWWLRWLWYGIQGRCWECKGNRSKSFWEHVHTIGEPQEGWQFCFRCDFMCRCPR